MEKKLLLLGLLYHEAMHGYQLTEMLQQDRGLSLIPLSKANAYRLLRKMEADGWVTHFEEQEGNWPVRRVYRITPAGEAAFQKLLRRGLAAFPQPVFNHVVALDFIGRLPAEEAVALLQKRRRQIVALRQIILDVPAEVMAEHLSLDYLKRFYDHELAWLDEIITRLQRPRAL